MSTGDTAQADEALKELLVKEPDNLQAENCVYEDEAVIPTKSLMINGCCFGRLRFAIMPALAGMDPVCNLDNRKKEKEDEEVRVSDLRLCA